MHAIAESLATLLAARHVGEGIIECGDTSADHPSTEAAYGDVVVVVSEDDATATVSILWRDEDGDLLDGVDVVENVPVSDVDTIRAAVGRLRA